MLTLNGLPVIRMSDGCDAAQATGFMTSHPMFLSVSLSTFSATKVIVGNPIDMPALNGSKVERLFYGAYPT